MLPEEPTMPDAPIWDGNYNNDDNKGEDEVDCNDNEESHRASVTDHARVGRVEKGQGSHLGENSNGRIYNV